jgi:hypothetical protein
VGQRKRRILNFEKRLDKLQRFVESYLFSLRAILSALPPNTEPPPVPEILSVGCAEIWPCQDAAVVLYYRNPSGSGPVCTREPLTKSVDEFLKTAETVAYYDQTGRIAPFLLPPSVPDAGNIILHLAGVLAVVNGTTFRPRYDKLVIMGWQAALPSPDTAALEDFRQAYSIRNLAHAAAVTDQPYNEKLRVGRQEAERLANQFNDLLNSSTSEEELQIFIKNHPELLYPDYVTSHPKFPLGEDYVTDFVMLVQGQSGREYVFVEIERADKPVFTESGYFSSELTKAGNQLLDWDAWITKNHAYVTQKLPGLYKPKFHLVIGRSSNLSPELRQKVIDQYSSGNKTLSTYDDVLDRFRQITKQLLG